MPQLPFQVDGVQIEPGSGDTLTITRDSTAGSMKFVDAIVTSGVLLKELVGVRNIQGVFIVGGSNAPYTTIQSAVDAIPTSSSPSLPSAILVMPGVYTENLLIQKDGLSIIGLGAKVLNSGNSDTLTISVSESVTPKKITIRGLEIECTQGTKSCVKVLGANTFAEGTVTVTSAPLSVGDTITIGGVLLTGVLGSRTSGGDNFSVSGGTASTIAADISAALNDSANSFSATINANPVGSTITVKSNVAGSGGNSITLAKSAANINISGATLTGGSSANTTALDEYLTLDNCILKASGVGSFQISADTINYVRVFGGTFEGSSSTSICSITNCSSFSLEGVAWTNDMEFSYNTSNDRPSDISCLYRINNTIVSGDITSNLVGQGDVEVKGSVAGALTIGGDQSFFINHSEVGSLNLSDTSSVFFDNSSRGALTVVGGTPTFEEDVTEGSITFAASTSETHSFGYTQTDNTYKVICSSSDPSIICGVSAKTTTGFTVETSGNLTGTVDFIVRR